MKKGKDTERWSFTPTYAEPAKKAEPPKKVEPTPKVTVVEDPTPPAKPPADKMTTKEVEHLKDFYGYLCENLNEEGWRRVRGEVERRLVTLESSS